MPTGRAPVHCHAYSQGISLPLVVFLSTPVGTPVRFPDVVIQRGRVLPPTKAVPSYKQAQNCPGDDSSGAGKVRNPAGRLLLNRRQEGAMQTGQENMLIATDESQSKSRPLVPLLTTTDEGSDGPAIIKTTPPRGKCRW
ncbi:hypothetical protein BDQ94DRAFT_57172 [Aspergillus welwitschiae]|uniref:Uncharacterized protein n=1 Tax=Aspergillus welwitschiae TaxID=1341132 RepID=A0A3F3PYH5_9EURO|nr:hypothetical protein BDQ94DRAFT_57172 [Aspergillus welwitschiae]RDH31812.1 hypothetical protein BDQ94DRAFT_57172 [Aspergillus welwitschiae]